jgi:hypothetical protein
MWTWSYSNPRKVAKMLHAVAFVPDGSADLTAFPFQSTSRAIRVPDSCRFEEGIRSYGGRRRFLTQLASWPETARPRRGSAAPSADENARRVACCFSAPVPKGSRDRTCVCHRGTKAGRCGVESRPECNSIGRVSLARAESERISMMVMCKSKFVVILLPRSIHDAFIIETGSG